MFCPLEYRESMLVLRGIVILVIVVMLGVSVTQQQLNSLTQRQECIGRITIPYDQRGNYSVYLLGSNYDVQSVYSVGQIINGDREIFIKMLDYDVKVPTYIEFDCRKELVLLDSWAKILVKEAFTCKQVVELYVAMIHERIHVYMSQLR